MLIRRCCERATTTEDAPPWRQETEDVPPWRQKTEEVSSWREEGEEMPPWRKEQDSIAEHQETEDTTDNTNDEQQEKKTPRQPQTAPPAELLQKTKPESIAPRLVEDKSFHAYMRVQEITEKVSFLNDVILFPLKSTNNLL